MRRIKQLSKFCKEAEYLPPWYYGLSYHRYDLRHDVFHVMPLNFFIRWGMFVAHKWNRFRSRPGYVDKTIQVELQKKAYSFGDCVLDMLKERAIREKPLTWGEVKKMIGYK